jgi:hypothetical protein
MSLKFADPPGNAAQLPAIVPKRLGLWIAEFWIFTCNARIAVMPLVITTVKSTVIKGQQPCKPGHSVIHAIVRKSRPVNAFMERGKHCREAEAIDDQGRNR